MHSALEALLTAGFDDLARTGLPGKLDAYLVKVSDGVWRWRERCPPCYTFTVPEMDARMPEDFAALEPCTRTDVVDFSARRLQRPSGLIQAAQAVRVEVVRVKAVMTDAQSKGVAFRTVDPPVHDNYTHDGQLRGSTATSAIRVNRVSGPLGSLQPGGDFHATRLLVR